MDAETLFQKIEKLLVLSEQNAENPKGAVYAALAQAYALRLHADYLQSIDAGVWKIAAQMD